MHRYSPAGNVAGQYDEQIGDVAAESTDKQHMDQLREKVWNFSVGSMRIKWGYGSDSLKSLFTLAYFLLLI